MCETAPEAAGPGTVVLDIGGSIGAAVIRGPAALDGHEIEVRPGGAEWDGRHVAFHRRQAAGGPETAAVFAQLEEGPWEARLRDHGTQVVCFTVVGGRVTHAVFPGWVAPA